MIRTTLAVAALAGSIAHADLTLFDLLPGYDFASTPAISADGSVLAVDMLSLDSGGSDSFVRVGDGWVAGPRYGLQNRTHGLSADGRAAVTVGTNPGSFSRLTHTRDGVRSDIWTAVGDRPAAAGITRDGATVAYAYEGPDGSFGLWRWREGGSNRRVHELDGYSSVERIIMGEHEDRFVFNAVTSYTGPGMGESRAVLYDGGALTQIPAVPGFNQNMAAHAMTADGSVVVGSGSFIDPFNVRTDWAWIYRDGVTTEFTVPGIDPTGISDISDDASLMVGTSWAGGSPVSYLLHADGRVEFADDLVTRAGLVLGSGQHAFFSRVSGDGSTLAGAIAGDDANIHANPIYFTLTIPAPAGLLPLAGLFALASRRRCES